MVGFVIGAIYESVSIPFIVAPAITNVSLQPFVAGETYQNVVVSGISFGSGCPTAAISGAGAGQGPQFTVYPATCTATSVQGTVTITDRHATGPNGTLTLTWPGMPPAVYTLSIVPVQISLAQVGTTVISTDGKYSENTTISVTAVRADTGATITDFSDTVNIAEDTTGETYVVIYAQNRGEPASQRHNCSRCERHNDQDHDFLITNIAPIAPTTVFQDTALVRKGCDEFANTPTNIGYNGPAVYDQPALAGYAWEEDAWEFVARFAQ